MYSVWIPWNFRENWIWIPWEIHWTSDRIRIDLRNYVWFIALNFCVHVSRLKIANETENFEKGVSSCTYYKKIFKIERFCIGSIVWMVIRKIFFNYSIRIWKFSSILLITFSQYYYPNLMLISSTYFIYLQVSFRYNLLKKLYVIWRIHMSQLI